VIFEPIDYVEPKKVDKLKKGDNSVCTQRSMIHPQYAERFIKQYVIDYKTDFSGLYGAEE
jgi:hypothetical protein